MKNQPTDEETANAPQVEMTDRSRRAFYLAIDALTAQKDAANKLDVGVTWARGKTAKDLKDLQTRMEDLAKDLAAVVATCGGDQ